MSNLVEEREKEDTMMLYEETMKTKKIFMAENRTNQIQVAPRQI